MMSLVARVFAALVGVAAPGSAVADAEAIVETAPVAPAAPSPLRRGVLTAEPVFDCREAVRWWGVRPCGV